MFCFIVYDSQFGNTRTIAHVLCKYLNAAGIDTTSKHVSLVSDQDISRAKCLIYGTPTHGGRSTHDMLLLLDRMHKIDLKGKFAAVFDTRSEAWPAKVLNYPAPRVSEELARLGMHIIAEPQGYVVVDTKGPLKTGEIERVMEWSKSIINQLLPVTH